MLDILNAGIPNLLMSIPINPTAITSNVCEFLVTSDLLCWVTGGGGTNSPPISFICVSHIALPCSQDVNSPHSTLINLLIEVRLREPQLVDTYRITGRGNHMARLDSIREYM